MKDYNTQTKLEYALKYAELGWSVFPVHFIDEDGECSCGTPDCDDAGKHPMTRNGFKDATIDVAKIERWWKKRPNANIGGATGEVSGFSVFDIDPRNGGDATLAGLVSSEDMLAGVVSSDTGGGGRHLMYSSFNGQSFAKMKGIDVKSDGGYVVLPPSNHASGGLYSWREGVMPGEVALGGIPVWAPVIDKNVVTKSSNDSLGDFAGLIDDGCTEDELIEMLQHISSDIDEPEWFRMLAGIYSWNPVKGLDIAEKWSKGSVDKYQVGAVKRKWAAFKRDGVRVSVGTIKYKANVGLRVEQLDGLESLKARVAAAGTQVELETDVRKLILDAALVRIDHCVMQALFKDKLKELTGVSVSIVDVRKMLPYTEPENEINEEKPSWCKRWVYLTLDGKFVSLKNREMVGEKGFNLRHGVDIPWDESGYKVSAVKWVADRGFISDAVTFNYLPACSDVVCRNIDGQRVVNSYNHSAVPVPATEFSSGGKAIIKRIKRHLLLLCGNKTDAAILLQWLAHNVQYPGRQIGWSPIIQSFEGGGKSFFGEILRICMGQINVGVVSASQLLTQFNPWANGVAVNVLEEIKLAGHNRHDALNALKPLITDASIMITPKGVNGYKVLNTCNYICFTNFRNAVPLGENDRRWWVIFVPYNTLAEFAAEVDSGDTKMYFRTLYDSMREYGSEVNKWLSEYTISDSFLSLQTAPMTDAKKAVIATEDMSHEGLIILRDLLSKGGEFFNTKVASQVDINDALKVTNLFGEGGYRMNSTVLFKQLGWVMHPKPIKVKGKARRFWTASAMNAEELRSYL